MRKHGKFMHYAIPTAIGGALGAGTGAYIDDRNRKRGALVGGLAGGLVGLGLGSDISQSFDDHNMRMDAMNAAHARTMADIHSQTVADAVAHAARMDKHRAHMADMDNFIRNFDEKYPKGAPGAPEQSNFSVTDIGDFLKRKRAGRINLSPSIEGFVPPKGLPPPDPTKISAYIKQAFSLDNVDPAMLGYLKSIGTGATVGAAGGALLAGKGKRGKGALIGGLGGGALGGGAKYLLNRGSIKDSEKMLSNLAQQRNEELIPMQVHEKHLAAAANAARKTNVMAGTRFGYETDNTYRALHGVDPIRHSPAYQEVYKNLSKGPLGDALRKTDKDAITAIRAQQDAANRYRSAELPFHARETGINQGLRDRLKRLF